MTRAKRMSCSFTLTAKPKALSTWWLVPSRTSVDFHSAGDGAAFTPASIDLTVTLVRSAEGASVPAAWPSPYGTLDIGGVTHHVVWRCYDATGAIVATYSGGQPLGWDRSWANTSGSNDRGNGLTRLDGGVRISSTTTISAVEFAIACKSPESISGEADIISRVTVPVTHLSDGDTGPAGPDGRGYYMAGTYSNQREYTKVGGTPVVFLDDGTWNEALQCNGGYWSLTRDTNVVGGVHYPPNDSNGYWRQEPTFGVVIAQGAFADFAHISKSVTAFGYQFSADGCIGGTAYADGDLYNGRPAWTYFKGDPAEQTGTFFEPNWWVNLKTGKQYQGDTTVKGTIHAKNFFHGVCFFTEEGGAIMQDGEKYYYLAQKNPEGSSDEDTLAFWELFTEGEYYSLSQFHGIATGTAWEGSDPPSGFLITTYDADVVLCWPSAQNWSSPAANRRVFLPHPADFEGKLIMVSGFNYSTSSGQFYVHCAAEPVGVGGFFSNGVRVGDNGVEFSNRGDHCTLTTGGFAYFVSVKDDANHGNNPRDAYSWVLVENSTGGDIIIDGGGSVPSSGVASVVGKTGDVTTADIATALTGAGHKLTDTTYEFDGSYDKDTNKAATVSTVTAAINALDGNVTGTPSSSKTVTYFSQQNGQVTVVFGSISITKSQVIDFPSSMPASDVQAWAKASSKPSYSFSEIGDKPTTIAGFGITDARIENGTVIIGGNSITPLTSHQSLANYLQKPANYGLTVGWGSDTAIAYHGVTPVTVRLDDNQRMFYRLPFGNDGPEHFITPWHSGDVLWLQYALNGTSLLAEGKVEAPGFAITGSSDSYVLLAGGGTKDVGDFLTVDAYPRVVHLGKATPAITGALAFGGFQETEVSFEQNAPNEVDEVLFYTYNGANVFIGHSEVPLEGDRYYAYWRGDSGYKTIAGGGTMENYSAFSCDGQSYLYHAADRSLRTLEAVGGYLTEGMFARANAVYVIHYDYCIGSRSEVSLTFASSNVSSLMTPEKKNLETRTANYDDALVAYTAAQNKTAEKQIIRDNAYTAYQQTPTPNNKRKWEQAEKELSSAEADEARALSQKDKAFTKKTEANDAYVAAGSQDYYYWLEVTVAAGKVLHLSGKALLLNSAKSQEVATDRGMIFGGSSGNTVYIGCYEGTYEFDCETYLTLPDGCTLKFEGGSIMSGILVGSNTRIVAAHEAVFTDVRICGSWLVSEITSAWFGDAAQNNVLREVFALQNENMLNTLVVEKGNYAVSVDVDAGTALSCLSNLNLVINGSINLAPNGYNNYYILNCIGSHHINISGSGAIVGDKLTHTGTTGEFGMGIELYGSSYVTIRDLLVKDCWGDCIYIGGNGAANIVIDNCNLDNGRRNGISITNGYNIVIQNCKIQNVGGTNPQAAIDVETNTNKFASNIFINNNFIDNCLLGVTIYGRSHFTKTSIAIENNYINCTWRAIAANGVSTCISVRNNELHSRFAVVEANIVGYVDEQLKIKPDDVIVFENNMIYQDEIATEAPFNSPTRMCAIYAMKGDYLFRHNLIRTNMPVFSFASGNKYIEDNTIICPTLFVDKSVSGVVMTGNKITGNITIPGPDALIADNNIMGYWRSTAVETDDGTVVRGNTVVHPDANNPKEVNDLTQAWEEFLIEGQLDENDQQIPAENYNKKCELKGNVSIEGNSLTNVALTASSGKVSKNTFMFEGTFNLAGILLAMGSCEILHNTISYAGTHGDNVNVYLLRTNKRIIGNTIAVESGSSVKFALYPSAGCLVADNSISFPDGHAAGCIISGAACPIRPIYIETGESDARPLFPADERYYKGCRYFDQTMGMPIYWNGAYWVRGNGARVTWPVVFTLTDVMASNKQQPNAGQAYTTTLSTDRNHVLPDTIAVTMGSNTLAAGTGYTYNNDPESTDYGKVVVANVTDALAIVATALQLFAVRFVLENLTSSGDTKATEGKAYTCTLSADSGGGLPQYVLPQAITVMMGGETLEAGTGYTYDSTTGVVSIPGVSGAIRIEASGDDLAGGGNAGPVS